MAVSSPLGPRFILLAAIGAAFTAIVLGIPTAIIPNPVFHRIIDAGPANYFFWASTSVVPAPCSPPRSQTVKDHAAEAGLGGGFLAYLAVGCPLCNKAVVALLGASGAVNIFEPIQPFLGALGLILASLALAIRLRGIKRGCRIDLPRVT